MKFHIADTLPQAAEFISPPIKLNTLDAEHVLTGFHTPEISREGIDYITARLDSGLHVAIVSDNESSGYKDELAAQLPGEVPVFTVADNPLKYKALSTVMFKQACEHFDVEAAAALHVEDQIMALLGARRAGFNTGVLMKPTVPEANRQIKIFRFADKAARLVIKHYDK